MRRRRYWLRRNKFNLIKVSLLLVIVLVLSLLTVEIMLRPIFASVAEAQVTKITTRIIADAVKKHCSSLTYGELISYEKNEAGRIVLMQPNTARINSFTASVLAEIHNNLGQIKDEDLRIPLAQLLGIRVLAGFGPNIKLNMMPFGFIEPPVINDTFEAVGINQTRHRIYIKFLTRIKVLVPFMSQVVKVDYEAPVSEVTIVGEVPHVYLNFPDKAFNGLFEN